MSLSWRKVSVSGLRTSRGASWPIQCWLQHRPRHIIRWTIFANEHERTKSLTNEYERGKKYIYERIWMKGLFTRIRLPSLSAVTCSFQHRLSGIVLNIIQKWHEGERQRRRHQTSQHLCTQITGKTATLIHFRNTMLGAWRSLRSLWTPINKHAWKR